MCEIGYMLTGYRLESKGNGYMASVINKQTIRILLEQGPVFNTGHVLTLALLTWAMPY